MDDVIRRELSTAADMAGLQMEFLELLRDAERYRWLRDVGTVKGVIDWNALDWPFHDLPAMDAAIDTLAAVGAA